ncbi:transporter substrate-binding domain-containing protein [Gudongella sp. SC589]|uniref:transporter substrate-binding domain-containing protein n=1 Tax=Gudongella sp. SC589 TaxID=3385990 RepID=UPI003904643D
MMIKRRGIMGFVVVLALSMLISGCTASAGVEKDATNRLEEIKERGYLEVVMEPYFAPYEFIDPSKDGMEQYVGSDVEFAKYIADELGVELKIIPLEFSAVLSSVTEGKYDMAISALSFTPARAEAMNMSKGYFFPEGGAGHGLLIRAEDKDSIKGPDDISEKVIVAQSGSLQEMFVNDQVPGYKEFKRVSATTDGFLMVQENKADVCAASIPMAQLYIDANPGANLMVVDNFEFFMDESTSGTRIGMPKGEDELTEEMNRIIDKVMESGEFDKWHMEFTEYAKSLGL